MADNDKITKLKELRQKMHEASQLNHRALIQEHEHKVTQQHLHAQSQLHAKNKQKKLEKIQRQLSSLQNDESSQDMVGSMQERVEGLNKTAEQVDEERRKEEYKVQRQNRGMADWRTANRQKYERLTRKNFQQKRVNAADISDGEAEETGLIIDSNKHDALERILRGPQDSKEAIERMSQDVQDQLKTRQAHSRKRRDPDHEEGQDVSYINDRNKKFNQKVERLYGDTTKDIKEALERGSAV